MNKIFVLKLKIKSVFKPIKIYINHEELILKFFSDLTSNKEFIDIGPIAFKKEELCYAYYEEKEVK